MYFYEYIFLSRQSSFSLMEGIIVLLILKFKGFLPLGGFTYDSKYLLTLVLKHVRKVFCFFVFSGEVLEIVFF